MSNQKMPLINGLEFLVNRACQFDLGINVYAKVQRFSGTHYVVKFYIKEMLYLVRDAYLVDDYFMINFPTTKELEKEIDRRKGEKQK